MKTETIKKIQSFGFKTYMREPDDSYLIYTDGVNLGYLQEDEYRGFTITTVHKPNRVSGTGYQIIRNESNFTEKDLKDAFCLVPHWASSRDRESVRKYKGIEAYRESDPFKSEYTEVI